MKQGASCVLAEHQVLGFIGSVYIGYNKESAAGGFKQTAGI